MRIFLLALFVSVTQILSAQILINEVCSANDSVIQDIEERYSDWIELYNAGATPVNLQGYTITNSEDYDVTWEFPSIVLMPNDYLTIFCSEKNLGLVIDHVEEVYPWGASFKFQIDTGVFDPAWMNLGFDDSSWPTAPTGIGISNDVVDSSFIATYIDTAGIGEVRSIRLRKTINFTNPESVSFGLLFHLFDDGFVAYFNGLEVDRFNVLGAPPLPSEYSIIELEQVMYPWTQWGTFIDSSLFQSGPNVLALEIHNTNPLGSSDPLIDIYSVSNFLLAGKDTVVQFPPGFTLCDKGLHTNFNLDSKGQKLTLRNSSGTIEDQVVIGRMDENHSRGRYPDGSGTFKIFNLPTPCSSNNSSAAYDSYADAPVITPDGGWYNGSLNVSMFVQPSATSFIKWSNDGSVPDNTSPLYTVPLFVDTTVALRARNLSSDPAVLPSEITTATFIIQDSITLPIVSITTDPPNLWDWNTGIYVMGPNADPVPPHNGANFTQGWEKPAHVEYFDKNHGIGFDVDCKINIHGNFSKSWPQKSFRVLANDDFGVAWIKYDRLFPNKTVEKVKSFNVRNAGIDWNTAHLRDGFINLSAMGLHMDVMDFQPCVLMLNGDYFGVYGLRERQDEHYLAQNNNVRDDQVDLLRFEGDILHGSNEAFFDMVAFIDSADLSVQSTFNYVSANLVDPINVADYFITETFYANIDWIGASGSNNIKFWRTHTPATPWRYVLWDTDLGTDFVDPFQDSYDHLGEILTYTNSNHIKVLSGLLANAEYHKYFINRYADLVNTHYHSNNTVPLLDAIQAEMYPEMERHFGMWGQAPITIFGIIDIGRASNVPEWLNEVNVVRDFLYDRPPFALNYVESNFGLNGQVDVTLNVQPEGAGIIKINSIIPDSLPWTGVYFDGNPVTITAVANPGYSFSHWDSDFTLTQPNDTISIERNVTVNDEFTAYFNTIEYGLNVYPNPFNNQVTIHVSIPDEEVQVILRIHDVVGNIVMDILPSGSFVESGEHNYTINFGNSEMADGLYFISLTTAEYNQTVKLVKSN